MVTLSPTAQLRSKADSLKRAGRRVFDFSAGELDLETPEHIVAAGIEAAAKTENHHYGPTPGQHELRMAVARRLSKRAIEPIEASSVIITHGAKQALFNALRALLSPGDEVLIPSPYWVTFPASVELAGGVPRVVQPNQSTLKITVEDIQAVFTDRTKALILCSPNNPSGVIYDPDELEPILRWAWANDVWLIADETYVDLGFRPVPAPAVVFPPIVDRLVTVGSVSKSFAMTGWRVGWAVGPKSMISDATAVQSHTTSNVSGITQSAALAALSGPDVTSQFRAILKRRLALCREALEPLGMFDLPPDGTFFLFPNTASIDEDDVEVARFLIEHGVIVVPGSAFGCPGRIRISYAVAEQALTDGLFAMTRAIETRNA